MKFYKITAEVELPGIEDIRWETTHRMAEQAEIDFLDAYGHEGTSITIEYVDVPTTRMDLLEWLRDNIVGAES